MGGWRAGAEVEQEVFPRSDYAAAGKRDMPTVWFSGSKHSHVAAEDAVEQGELFVKVVQALREDRLRSSTTRQDAVT